MRTDAPLNFRYRDILTSIVRSYIETGEPVGSRTISKRRHNTLSPASIRNVMADLADVALFRVAVNAENSYDFEKAVDRYKKLVDTYPKAKDRPVVITALAVRRHQERPLNLRVLLLPR